MHDPVDSSSTDSESSLYAPVMDPPETIVGRLVGLAIEGTYSLA